MKKLLIITLTIALALFLLTACGDSGGSGGLPDGTYTPVAITMEGLGRTEIGDSMDAMMGGYSNIIDGNQFTARMAGVSSTVRYSYSNGRLTFFEIADASISLDITYRNGTLFWDIGGMTIELERE